MFKNKNIKADNKPSRKSITAATLQELNKAPFAHGNKPSKKLVK